MFGLPGKHIFSSNVETTILSNNLIIVESPAKARTMEKYLGPDFEALASYGHVRDLIGSGGRGVVEKVVDGKTIFTPVWELDERGQKQMTAIARAVKSADNVYLATDPDREGEAISWHIHEILREQGVLEAKPVYRVVFYEVTRRAIQEAIDAPRALSLELVEAYLARRILDYLLGFNLSPELWKKIKRGLSAGRVQSPALRLLCDREREIVQFVPREYWTIESDLNAGGADGCFQARLSLLEGNKVEQFSITSTDQAQAIRQRLEQAAGGHLLVRSIEEKPRKRNPAPPFTTSTLQQEASRKLGFGARKTMQVAQQLYEGIDIEGSRVGLITYMRTDSVNVAGEALNELRELITERFGKANLPQTPNRYKSKARNAQEAHEAVRPTSVRRTPESVKQTLTTDQSRLYDLVWKRAVASQMIPATLRWWPSSCWSRKIRPTSSAQLALPWLIPAICRSTRRMPMMLATTRAGCCQPLKRGQVVDLETIRGRATFHRAQTTLYGGEPGPRTGDARDRSTVHLCFDSLHSSGPGIRPT
jgi:DNA topoisomerase-1